LLDSLLQEISHVMRNKDFQSYETKRIQQKI